MGIRFSIDAKLSFCAAGIGGTPTWTEIKTVKNVTLDVKRGEADVTTRANGGWKAVAAALKEGNIETEMPWDPDAPGFADLRNAFLRGTPVGIACMDGPMTVIGSQGLWADCAVLDFTRDESLEDAMKVKVSLKPTYSANMPAWAVVGACAGTEPTTSAGANVYLVASSGLYTFTAAGNTFAGILLANYTTGATTLLFNADAQAS